MNEISMPLLELTSSQHTFHNNLISFGSQKLYYDINRRLSYLFKIPTTEKKFNAGHIKMKSVRVMINAVATLQSNISIESNAHDDRHRLHIDIDSTNPQGEGHLSSSENSTELDDREKLRRLRISKANKGNTPWNKGRKHTPETLRRIREKTRLAMQDPKVMITIRYCFLCGGPPTTNLVWSR